MLSRFNLLLAALSFVLLGSCVSSGTIGAKMPSNATKLNIKELGAKGDGKSDDTKYFVQALEATKKGCNLYIPNGTYIINETIMRGSCAYIYSNTSIIGESKSKVIIKLKENQRIGIRMFSTEPNAENILIQNIIFDGGLSGQTSTDVKTEHMHAIFINSTANITIEDCHFQYTKGDGVYVHGPDIQSKNVVINRCSFESNERNAITLGSGFKNVVISNCYIDASYTHCPIDSEPFAGICQDVVIEGCTIVSNNRSLPDPIITLGGFPTKVTGYKIRNNVFKNVGIHMVTAYDVFIYDNNIATIGDVPGINITYDNGNINIENNKIHCEQETIRAMATNHSAPHDIIIRNNTLETKSTTLSAIIVYGVKNILVSENKISGPQNNNYAVFNLRSTRALDNAVFSKNKCSGFAYGADVRTYQDFKVSNVRFDNNVFTFKSKSTNLIQLGAFSHLIDVKQTGNIETTF